MRHLRPVPSAGPRRIRDAATGAEFIHSRPCPACRQDIAAGDPIVKHNHDWMHARCLAANVAELECREAWLVIGGQLAGRPRAYTAAETRVIVGQLLRIAGGLPVLPFETDTYSPQK